MPSRTYLRRQATSLMKFANETGDPRTAALLLARAASLSARMDDNRGSESDGSLQAPDVEPEDGTARGESAAHPRSDAS